MSLQASALLKQPEPILQPIDVFQDYLKDIDPATIFIKIIGFENVKKLFLASIYSSSPVSYMLVGPPGCGKTSFLKAVVKTFSMFSLFIDSTISSGIGMIESIFGMGHRLKFLCVDEIEKFSIKDRKTLLNVVEHGILSRTLRNSRRVLTDLRVTCYCTCNNIDKMMLEQPELVSRFEVIRIPALSYEMFLYIVSLRLQREEGFDNQEELSRHIGKKVYIEFGQETNIRRCIRVARLVHARSKILNIPITKNVIDETIQLLKKDVHVFD